MSSTAGGSKVETAVSSEGPQPLLSSLGYCAGCGTWDAHGVCCTACGYSFASDDVEASIDAADRAAG